MNETKKWTGEAIKDGLPIREAPNAKAAQIWTLNKGDKVNVCDTVKGWYYVKAGIAGYVSANYIKGTATHAAISKRTKWIGRMLAAVSMRTWAWTKADEICSVPKDAIVKVMDTVDGWYYIAYDGKKGFAPQAKVKYKSDPITAKEFLKAVKETQEYARTHGYIYGDSQSTVPTKDKKISCDRLVAKALYDLGFKDQPKGGTALGRGFESYLEKCGFKKTTTEGSIKAGSVCVVMNPSGTSRHVFVVESSKFNAYKRYDCGSLQWIRCKQPLVGLWMSQLLGVYNL